MGFGAVHFGGDLNTSSSGANVANMTVCAWIRAGSVTGDQSIFVYNALFGIVLYSGQLAGFGYSGTWAGTPARTLSLNDEVFIAITRTGNLVHFYSRLASESSLTYHGSVADDTTSGTGIYYVGSWNGGVEYFTGDICCLRIWEAVLTSDELMSESKRANPKRTANLWADYRMYCNANSTLDLSGNENNLNYVSGSTADAEMPNVDWLDRKVTSTFDGTEDPLSEGGRWLNTMSGWSGASKGGGVLTSNLINGDGFSYINNPVIYSTNQYAQIVVSNNWDSGGHYAGVSVRSGDGIGGYGIWTSPNQLEIGRYYDNVGSSIAQSSTVWVSAGDIIRIEVEGSTIRLKKNGVIIASVVDTTFADGQPGVNTWDTGANAALADFYEAGILNPQDGLQVKATRISGVTKIGY